MLRDGVNKSHSESVSESAFIRPGVFCKEVAPFLGFSTALVSKCGATPFLTIFPTIPVISIQPKMLKLTKRNKGGKIA